jgi:hypothetical protein
MRFRISDFPPRRVNSLRIGAIAAVLLCAGVANAQYCYVDPITGQKICVPAASPSTFPLLNPQSAIRGSTELAEVNPQLPAAAGHCRITVGDGSAGSGTLVARTESGGLVVTCSHLFDRSTANIEVAFPDGQRFAARIVERDRAHDLAALVIRRPEAAPVEVAGEDVLLRTASGPLTACGFGPSGEFRCVRGEVVGQATPAGAVYPSTVIRGAVRPGDSGGGVLNAEGRLVGVVWGQRDGLSYLSCGRPLRELLERVLGKPPDGRVVVGKDGGGGAQPAGGEFEKWAQEIEAKIAALDAAKQAVLERVGSVQERVERVTEEGGGFFRGLSMGKVLVGALGLSGPVAAAVVVAGGLFSWKLRRRGKPSGSAAASVAAKEIMRPIAVDSPPPPQRAVPETHYVSYETDSFAKAHQWASEQIARKYPGAAEILSAQESLIRQCLAAR